MARRYTNKMWTQKEVDEAVEMAHDGYTRQEIADELGRTEDSVVKRLQKERVRVNQSSRYDVDARVEVMELIGCGFTLTQIAKRRGITVQSVSQMVDSLVRAGMVIKTGKLPNVRFSLPIRRENIDLVKAKGADYGE